MPDNSQSKQKAEALIALGLSSEDSETQQAADCPDEAEIAAFVDGQLSTPEQASFKERLPRCPESYSQWLNLARLSSREQPAKPSSPGIFERFWQWLRMPGPAWSAGMATAAFAVILVMVAVPRSGDYTELDSLLGQQYSGLPGISALPWQGEIAPYGYKSIKPVVGFIDQQAFAAGMKNALLALKPDEQTRQEIEQRMPSLPDCASGDRVCKNQVEILRRAGEWAILTHQACSQASDAGWTPRVRQSLGILTTKIESQAGLDGREYTSLERRLKELHEAQEAGVAPEQLCNQLGAVIGFVVTK